MLKIREKTGLQATAGIGDNFFLAKVALDIFAKHDKDGIGILKSEEIPTKLWPITPLKEIWGIGEATQNKLNARGIYTVEELAKADRIQFANDFGIMGLQLIDHANGIDDSNVREPFVPEETSLTQGQVLPRDYKINEIPMILQEMCDDLASKMRGQGDLTSVVSLYIGYSSDQGGFHHQMALIKPTDDTDTLYHAILDIFNKYKVDLLVRRISINFGRLSHYNGTDQLDLFVSEEEMDNIRNLNLLIDELKSKYGKNIVLRLSALKDGSTTIERHSQIGGHRK